MARNTLGFQEPPSYPR